MRKRLICLPVIAGLCSSYTLATDNNSINATATYGADTNPHKLSELLKPDEEVYFIKGEINLKHKFFDKLHIEANAFKTQYEDDPRADEFNASANIDFQDLFKIGESQFSYQLSADYFTKDKTYVDRRTGFVGLFEGASIADRYDFNQLDYFAELMYLPTSYFEYGVSYKKSDRTYEVVEIPGLSNLDNANQTFTLGFEYKASDLGRIFMNGSFTQREYIDRRAKDLEGVNIVDSDLVFNYSTLNMGYIYRPNEETNWRYTYHYEERRDTTSGYYNATNGYLSISAVHKISQYQHLRAEVKYSKFTLVNLIDVEQEILEEDSYEEQGISVMLGYEWIIATLFTTNIALYVELEHANFDNLDPLYKFERSRAGAGIRWSAF